MGVPLGGWFDADEDGFFFGDTELECLDVLAWDGEVSGVPCGDVEVLLIHGGDGAGDDIVVGEDEAFGV